MVGRGREGQRGRDIKKRNLYLPEQPAEDRVTEPSCGESRSTPGRARNGHKSTNRKLAEFAGLDPVADRERIEQLGLNLSTGPKGRNKRTRERRELVREILQAALDRGEAPPSVRTLAQVLTERGCATGRSTAHTLLGELWAELRPGAGLANGPVLASE
jgi:hypothetical protein